MDSFVVGTASQKPKEYVGRERSRCGLEAYVPNCVFTGRASYAIICFVRTMPWFRRLVAGLSLRRPGV
jgi:hypothetical protein